jgi:hypothetical protein
MLCKRGLQGQPDCGVWNSGCGIKTNTANLTLFSMRKTVVIPAPYQVRARLCVGRGPLRAGFLFSQETLDSGSSPE